MVLIGRVRQDYTTLVKRKGKRHERKKKTGRFKRQTGTCRGRLYTLWADTKMGNG